MNTQNKQKELNELTKEDLQAFNDAPLEGCTLQNPFELTTESGDDNIHEIEEVVAFNRKYHDQFKPILNSIQNPEDRIQLIKSFYNTIPNKVWNELLNGVFKTDSNKCLDRFAKQYHKIISYDIKQEPTLSLSEVRYKTSVCERSKAWLIQEDTSFSNDKPEVLSQLKYNMYVVKAKIEEETIQIPFIPILDAIKSMDQTYNGMFEYIFSNSDIDDLKIIRKKGIGQKKLENDNNILFGILRYRDDKVFKNNLAWNTIVRSRIKCEDIGYFTYGEYTRFIGNIWVDPRFRRNGVGKAIMDYITNKLLPKAGFIYINSKTPEMIKLIRAQEKFDYDRDEYKVRIDNIGLSLPYQFNLDNSNVGNPNTKGLNSYIENMFVLSWYGNEDYIKDLKHNMHSETLKSMLFNENFFPSIKIGDEQVQFVDRNIPTAEELYIVTRSWYNKENENQPKTKINIIGYTNDKNIIPGYYNYYTEQDEYFKHLVYEYDNEIYLYPCHKDKLHFGIPLQDIRTISIKPEYDYEIYYTNDEVVFITKTWNNKCIEPKIDRIILDEDFNGRFTETEISKADNNFRFIQFLNFMATLKTTGIERVFDSYPMDTRYGKNLRSKLKIDDFTPIEFNKNTLEVKFQSNDGSFTTTRSIKEIFNFLR